MPHGSICASWKWVTDLRASWADRLNTLLGPDDQVDHRSLIDQGVDCLLQIHLGTYAYRLLTGQEVNDIRVARYWHIKTLNQDLIGWAADREPVDPDEVNVSRIVLADMKASEPQSSLSEPA